MSSDFNGTDALFAAGHVTGLRSWSSYDEHSVARPDTLFSLFKKYEWTPGPNQADCYATRPLMINDLTDEQRDIAFKMASVYHSEQYITDGIVLAHARAQFGNTVPSCGGLASIECACGFYAYTTDLEYSTNAWYVAEGTIFGIVHGWGRVALGTRGFRAQTAKIAALAPGKKFYALPKGAGPALADKYGVPWFSSIEDAVAEIPLTDTTVE